MQKIFLSMVLLLVSGAMWAQKTYSYRYWTDNNIATVGTGVATGEQEFDIDISALLPGLHALHLQVCNQDGTWSAVRTRFFVTDRSTAATSARYWFDNDITTLHEGASSASVTELDITKLAVGLHAVHYQTFSEGGVASSVRTRYFMVDQVQVGTLSALIWIDDAAPAAYELTEGDIVLDIEELAIGMHDLHVRLVDSNGTAIGEETRPFEVKEPTVTITLKATMGTFCYEKDVDFTGVEGLRAYTATGFNKQTGVVMMSRVNDVPAGEGLVLMGEAGTYEVPVRTSFSYYANLMVGTLENTVIAQTEGGYTNYIVSRKNGVMGFYLAPDQSTSAAGKAYLHVPSREANGARELRMAFDDEPTGIDESTANGQEEPYYGLTGLKTRQPQRGLYIKGNKKVIIK